METRTQQNEIALGRCVEARRLSVPDFDAERLYCPACHTLLALTTTKFETSQGKIEVFSSRKICLNWRFDWLETRKTWVYPKTTRGYLNKPVGKQSEQETQAKIAEARAKGDERTARYYEENLRIFGEHPHRDFENRYIEDSIVECCCKRRVMLRRRPPLK
jgi:hypothetical protein